MQTRSSPSLQTLHRLAQNASILGFEQMGKEKLYHTLQEKYDIKRLLRAESRRLKASEITKKRKNVDCSDLPKSSLSSIDSSMENATLPDPPQRCIKRSRIVVNKVDPIMFAPIGKKHIFKFSRPNGTIIRFNIESLVDYLLSSGDFNDPETRIPFSEENLKEIDRISHAAGLNKASVFQAKNNSSAYNESKFRRDALLGLERCAGEVITDMLDIVENCDPDDAQMQLAMREFPTFLDYFRQIREVEPEYASKCIAHWRLFMQGPPNKPNKDNCGLIYVICHFLRNVADGHM